MVQLYLEKQGTPSPINCEVRHNFPRFHLLLGSQRLGI